MGATDIFGCPRCGASVRSDRDWCSCGCWIGVEPPVLEPWRDIGISPVIDELENKPTLAEVNAVRAARGLPPLTLP